MSPNTLTRHYEHLSVWERVRLRLAAQAREDEVEEHRLNDTAPILQVPTRSHFRTELVLHTFALMYVAEQLESASWHFFAQMKLREGDVTDPDVLGSLAAIACTHAFCFHIRMLGWKKFCRSLGVDPDALVEGNHNGIMLKFCAEKIGEFAPTAEELTGWFRSKGQEPGTLISVESVYQSWRQLLEKATHEPPLIEDDQSSP